MIEIAICLAIIGIALVSIIGVLPSGMHTQRDNREETLINQDATILLEAIRGGARGLDDLTNYVYAITNYWTLFNANGSVKKFDANGYTYTNAWVYGSSVPFMALTNGANIIDLLSTPEFTDLSFNPTYNVLNGGYSNHVVAYVRSISGPAIEKPPQDNNLLRGDSFGYRILCVNAPVATDANIANLYPPWQPLAYLSGAQVLYGWFYWQATASTGASDVPGQSLKWAKLPYYPMELAANLHELRLTFLWPQQPNGSLGPGHQTFRTLVAGQIVQTNTGQWLYFYQPQSFVN